MGCRTSKKRYNKEVENQKLCKIGLGVGRNELKLEGNFQLGYHIVRHIRNTNQRNLWTVNL